MRVATLLQLGTAVTSYIPNSQNDAITLLQQLMVLYNNELKVLGAAFYDQYYNAVNQMKIQVASYLKQKGQQLNPVGTLTLQQNHPSLALAYLIYGDATKEPDLTARNQVADPSFMSLPIEYLLPNT